MCVTGLTPPVIDLTRHLRRSPPAHTTTATHAQLVTPWPHSPARTTPATPSTVPRTSREHLPAMQPSRPCHVLCRPTRTHASPVACNRNGSSPPRPRAVRAAPCSWRASLEVTRKQMAHNWMLPSLRHHGSITPPPPLLHRHTLSTTAILHLRHSTAHGTGTCDGPIPATNPRTHCECSTDCTPHSHVLGWTGDARA